MKINWKLRFKNPLFWWFVAITIFTNITVKLNVDPLALVTWESVLKLLWNAVANPVVLLSTIISVVFGAIDFTTTGVCDTVKVMEYECPKCEVFDSKK